MKIVLLQTGKNSDQHIAEIADLYKNRLKKYSGFDIVTTPDLKDTRSMPAGEQKIKEGKRVLHLINDDDYMILLDERGKELSSAEFADWLLRSLMLQKKRIMFVIGGPYGFSDEVYSRADFRLSLSKMTFPHQLVRLLFLEQLYRSFTIIKGEPYHHK